MNLKPQKSGMPDPGQIPNADGKISPSQFMRELRPEYYSDTEDRVAYVLDPAVLEYHLDSITQRNQTHEFEIFCRKLCERTICPRLRAQAGPEGGGDGKVDTETYVVASEIAALTYYIGEANDGQERWAFAFSAKAKWGEKVRSDVKGIVETERGYNRIFFVTSRFAKSKDRLRIEDELKNKFGIPVTIHDRAWIISQIIEHDRRDLAFNYLKVGEEKNDSSRLGPTDYSRLQQLTDIERQIDDPNAFEGMESQRVTEALLAAKFSRGLEHARTETDGRFIRAIRLAEQDGSYRQRLEAQYEMIWTAFWWHDDVALLNSAYNSFETLALKSDQARNLEFLCNLHQLLVNSVVHRLMSRDECRLDERAAALTAALEPIVLNRERPNNRLEAETSILLMRVNQALIDNNRDALPAIWQDFGEVIDQAAGMGEFDAERLTKMIEVTAEFAGNDASYNELVEKLASFVGERSSEAQGALVLLKRAQKLDFDNHLDMIKFLGRAVIGLTKKEYADSLIEALHLLSLAYRSAGLLWAARSTCVFAAASIVIVGDEESQIPVILIPTLKVLAWIAIELRHIPDVLLAVQLIGGALRSLPLDDESKELVRKDLEELDLALGCIFLNLTEIDLRRVKSLPDILVRLGLFWSRISLLYAMGNLAILRQDGSLPKEESDEAALHFFSLLSSQNVAKEARYFLTVNEDAPHTLNAAVMGMKVEVTCDGSQNQIMVVETVIGCLESFFATTLDRRIAPHTEKFEISLVERNDATKPSFEVEHLIPVGTLAWPLGLAPNNYERREDIQRAMAEICGVVLGATCMIDNFEKTLKALFADAAVQQRMTMITAALNSYHRLTGTHVTRLSLWQELVQNAYEVRQPLPYLRRVEVSTKKDVSEIEGASEDFADTNLIEPPDAKSHRSVSIRSIIDIRAWTRARWRGTAYPIYGGSVPPMFALMFEDESGARAIFTRWRDRFGAVDVNESIRISIVRRLPDQRDSHYCVVISANEPNGVIHQPGQLHMIPNRSMTMEPNDSVNLDSFLDRFKHAGEYYLLPAILTDAGSPKMISELAIRKQKVTVKNASDIGKHDMDLIALRGRQ